MSKRHNLSHNLNFDECAPAVPTARVCAKVPHADESKEGREADYTGAHWHWKKGIYFLVDA